MYFKQFVLVKIKHVTAFQIIIIITQLVWATDTKTQLTLQRTRTLESTAINKKPSYTKRSVGPSCFPWCLLRLMACNSGMRNVTCEKQLNFAWHHSTDKIWFRCWKQVCLPISKLPRLTNSLALTFLSFQRLPFNLKNNRFMGCYLGDTSKTRRQDSGRNILFKKSTELHQPWWRIIQTGSMLALKGQCS